MDLQELIARGRFTFAEAPERLRVFQLANGKSSAKDIAKATKRRLSNTLRDLKVLQDLELIARRRDVEGYPVKKSDSLVYEKVPLARHIPLTYFKGGPTKTKLVSQKPPKTLSEGTAKRPRPLAMPSETQLLDNCKAGEDDVTEFKAAGTEMRKISKEIATFAHTRQGGVLYYGVEDDGTISGTDVSRQAFDQQIHNSVRNMIKPTPHIGLKAARPIGTEVLMIQIPPWDKKTVHYYEDRVYIRKGTNVFVATPEEIKRLHRGEYIA